MKELTRNYICNNSPKFSERLDAGCYNDIIQIIVSLVIFIVCFSLIIYFISKIIDLFKKK